MFGEIPEEDDSKTVHAFEAVLEGNEVRIIMPTALYSTCSAVARSLDLQPYLIEGVVSTKDNNGQPVLINPTIVEKLRFDKDKEIYICESVYSPEISDPSEDPREYEVARKMTFWEYFWGSMKTSWGL